LFRASLKTLAVRYREYAQVSSIAIFEYMAGNRVLKAAVPASRFGWRCSNATT
jgi:hypothetical protein